jgi:Kelch motif
MFGGIPANRSGSWPTDTWKLQSGTWTRVATEGPPARGRAGLAHDRRRRRVVLFGGVSAPSGPNQSQTFLNDTWTWDGERWLKAAEGGPAGRYAHGMVFDERAGVILLYGGAAAHRDAPLSDMWRWDGERWTEIPLSGPTPGHRYQPVMVYDRARARTVLYGGNGGPSDTWEWDGQKWRQMRP